MLVANEWPHGAGGYRVVQQPPAAARPGGILGHQDMDPIHVGASPLPGACSVAIEVSKQQPRAADGLQESAHCSEFGDVAP